MARTFIRGLSVFFFVVAILATSLTGVHADDISDIPLESQCRPYVERALKELETGDSNPESVGDGKSNEDDKSIEDTTIESIDDSGEQNDAASAESSEPQQEASQENEADDHVSNEDVATNSEDSHEDEKSNEEEQKADNSSEQPAPESGEQNGESIENEQADQASAAEESVEEDVVAESTEDIEAAAQTEHSEEDKASGETKEESGEVKEEESGETKEESSETKEESGEVKDESDEDKEKSGEERVEEVAKSEEEGSQEQKSGETHEDDNDTKEDSVEHAEGGEAEESKENESAEQTQENTVEDSSETKEESVQSVEEAQSGEDKESGEEKDTVESTEDKTEEDITGDIERPATEEVSESDEQADEGAESSEPKAEDSNEDSQEGAEASEDASVENAEESGEADKKSDDDAVSQEEDKSGDVQSSENGDEEEPAQQSNEGSEEEKSVEEEVATAEEAAETQSQAESEEDSAHEGEEAGSDSAEGEAAAEGDAVVEGEASGAASTEEGATEEAEESDAAETKSSESEESHPEDDLLLEIEIPENLRERDHINELLHLDEEFAEKDLLLEKSSDIILRELKRSYDNAIKPLEILYKYRDLSNRHFGDPEVFSKPLVLFMGPWSGGKSSIINYLTDNEYTPHSLRTGAEPSPAYFNILMHGKEPEILDGTQLAADWTFSGLQKFGQGLEDRLRGLKLPNKLLEKVNIVEIPGILEVRKQVSRLFPFNDACQWFIDRADIIFLVYDPSKLDVGPETEAILDQLKGREYQTRIVLNKADQVKPEELMRVQGALIWNISPLMSSAQPPVMYTTSLWSIPYEVGSPARLLRAQERSLLRDLRGAIDKRIENKIASARRFAVRVRNHAKMVDCYLTTYYNHKSLFGNKKIISDSIIEHPQDYHIYEGLSTLTNISRYDLPDPETYRDFFRLNPLYDFQQLSATCTYFRGCPINKLDVAIAYDLPELVGKYKKMIEPINNQDSNRPS